MYCHTIPPGSLISWHKGAAPPFSHCLFTSPPPSPHISSLRVILYYVLLVCDHIFLVVPIPFLFLFHKEVVVVAAM
jgi:hypothetical protein